MWKFAEKLKELRQESKLSIKKLGNKINVSDATVSRWENGLADIKCDELIAVAEFFKVTTDYLLGLEED